MIEQQSSNHAVTCLYRKTTACEYDKQNSSPGSPNNKRMTCLYRKTTACEYDKQNSSPGSPNNKRMTCLYRKTTACEYDKQNSSPGSTNNKRKPVRFNGHLCSDTSICFLNQLGVRIEQRQRRFVALTYAGQWVSL